MTILLMTSCSKRNETSSNPTSEPINLVDVSEKTNNEGVQEITEQSDYNEADESSESQQNDDLVDYMESDLSSYSGHWYSEDYTIEIDKMGYSFFMVQKLS